MYRKLLIFFTVLCMFTGFFQVANSFAINVLYSDDFESGMGNWSNDTVYDNKDWLRDSGGTPSSGTGPSSGADGSLYYVYFETSSGYAYSAGDTAILLGPALTEGNIQLSFQYHMYGSTIGTLSIDILSGGSWIQNVWSVSGQQQTSSSEAYISTNVDLSAYDVSRIRFRATAAGNYMGDIAIDNIEIATFSTDPVPPYFFSDPLEKSEAYKNYPYSESISEDAGDGNGDLITFSKISGPDWLDVSADGILSGTPDSSNVGINTFIVEASDGELSSTTTLIITVSDGAPKILLSRSDFESGLGDWSNVSSDDNNDWLRDSGGTTSSGTGPATGADGSAYYMYFETSSGYAYYSGDSAILSGPLVTGTNIQLKFQYHMYGTNIGTLSVDVLSGGTWVNNVWSISGQQQTSTTAPYDSADLDLSAYAVTGIRIRATAVGGYTGDIAIDNIEIWGEPLGPAAPVFSNDPLSKSEAFQDRDYQDSLTLDASDPNGDTISFSKISGPAWLNVFSDGILSGVPESSDVGLNSFVIQVSDGSLSSSATITIYVNDDTVPYLLSSSDFESGFGDWHNISTDDDYDWLLNSGGTSSSGTGPSSGADGSTYYAYMETSSGYAYYNGDTVILEGPVIVDANIHLLFKYHMYGLEMGTLSVDILTGGTWVSDIWSISGQQQLNNGAPYENVDLDLSDYTVAGIRIRGTAAGGYTGDMAIDDIKILSVNPDYYDTDNDGVTDSLDICPDTSASETADASGCGYSQRDDDNDSVLNSQDICPNTPAGEAVDSDGCAYSQLDEDGDGVANGLDICPGTPIGETADVNGCSASQKDTDNDGITDNLDDCPGTPVGEPVDSNGCADFQKDTDNDGVTDNIDICPNTPVNETADSNGCSLSQIDSDNDGFSDDIDAFPLDPTEWLDTDNDGVGNNTDTDDDADGVLDIYDDFPLDPTEWLDSDGDGTGDNADVDDDNDGVNDTSDAFPFDPSESVDTDGDGIGNNADTDDDNDGIPDIDDPYPLIVGEPDTKTLIVNIQGQGTISTSAGDCSTSCVLEFPIEQTSVSVTVASEDYGYYFKDWQSSACTNSNSVYYKQCDMELSETDSVTVDVKFSAYPAGKLETGNYHTCYLENGEVFCWGAGEAGGTNTFDKGQSIVPDTLVYPTDIAASLYHTCVIDEGTVKCWGGSDYDDPTVRAGLVNPTKITAGVIHTCAEDDFGVTCWGSNTYGQLNVPPEVVHPDTLAAGDYYTCALENGNVYCWGDTSYGKTTPPGDLANPEKLSLSTAASHACVVDIGLPRCWGFNGNGEVDNPEAVTETVDQVFVGGEWDSCVLYPDGQLTCWKYNGTKISYIYNPFGSHVSGNYHYCTLKKTISCSASNDTYGQDDVPYELIQFLENR